MRPGWEKQAEQPNGDTPGYEFNLSEDKQHFLLVFQEEPGPPSWRWELVSDGNVVIYGTCGSLTEAQVEAEQEAQKHVEEMLRFLGATRKEMSIPLPVDWALEVSAVSDSGTAYLVSERGFNSPVALGSTVVLRAMRSS